ncbi:hypothetical protein AURDEDRAFT_76832, partial [Auricularia subglabra TFB-10046 SS5]
ILNYPAGEPKSLQIRIRDLARLRPGQHLNDTLIDFGLRYWFHGLQRLNSPLASQTHVFSTQFYTKLAHAR